MKSEETLTQNLPFKNKSHCVGNDPRIRRKEKSKLRKSKQKGFFHGLSLRTKYPVIEKAKIVLVFRKVFAKRIECTI